MKDGFLRPAPDWTGPPLTQELIAAAEETCGYRLPTSLIDMLGECNGGKPQNTLFPTTTATSWASDHFAITAILGIGGEFGFYNDDNTGSDYLITEWGYPAIGIVICDTPSAGHDTVMLDYRVCGPTGEPAVAYIDEDRAPRRIAHTFADFINGLRTEATLKSGSSTHDNAQGRSSSSI